jgi:16S rRNA (guanine527-N7)-methyltransferase
MADSNLRDMAAGHGVTLSGAQLAQLDTYARMLEEWSQRVNLVADASREVVERRHFAESIAFGAALRERELLRPDSSILDVGAGAGFPGLVLKICWPGIALTLLEATAKKTAFLAAAVEALGFGATTRVLTGRAEDLGHDEALRARFDLVVARAVAPLPVLLELTLPFARVGGRLAAVKGSRGGEELQASRRALEVLGARAIAMPLPVPGPKQQIIVAAKQRETPAAYPRRAGMPAKQPL